MAAPTNAGGTAPPSCGSLPAAGSSPAMTAGRISAYPGNARNNDPGLIEPVAATR